jgi:hypothetical protein
VGGGKITFGLKNMPGPAYCYYSGLFSIYSPIKYVFIKKELKIEKNTSK